MTIPLKSRSGHANTRILEEEQGKGQSVVIKMTEDNMYARLILNFANTNEMYEWYGDLTKTISPGDEDVSYEDITSVKKVSDEQNFKAGPHEMTVKLKSNVETSNFHREHKLLVNRALKERLDEKQGKLTKHMAETFNLERKLEKAVQEFMNSEKKKTINAAAL